MLAFIDVDAKTLAFIANPVFVSAGVVGIDADAVSNGSDAVGVVFVIVVENIDVGVGVGFGVGFGVVIDVCIDAVGIAAVGSGADGLVELHELLQIGFVGI
jgi:hypothetical protein